MLAGTTNNDEATPSRPAMFNTNIFCQSFIPRPASHSLQLPLLFIRRVANPFAFFLLPNAHGG